MLKTSLHRYIILIGFVAALIPVYGVPLDDNDQHKHVPTGLGQAVQPTQPHADTKLNSADDTTVVIATDLSLEHQLSQTKYGEQESTPQYDSGSEPIVGNTVNAAVNEPVNGNVQQSQPPSAVVTESVGVQQDEQQAPENKQEDNELQESLQQGESERQQLTKVEQEPVEESRKEETIKREEKQPNEALHDLQPRSVTDQSTEQQEQKQLQEAQQLLETPMPKEVQIEQEERAQKDQQPLPNELQQVTVPVVTFDSKDDHQVNIIKVEEQTTQQTSEKTDTKDLQNGSNLPSVTVDEKTISRQSVRQQTAVGTFVVNETADDIEKISQKLESDDSTADNWFTKLSQAMWSMIQNVKQLKSQYIDKFITTKLNNSETERRRKVGTDL